VSYATRYAAMKRAQAESPQAVAWRLLDKSIRERVAAEVVERWPHITSENVATVLKWQEDRIKQLHAEASNA
jgi:hypothetical protein